MRTVVLSGAVVLVIAAAPVAQSQGQSQPRTPATPTTQQPHGQTPGQQSGAPAQRQTMPLTADQQAVVDAAKGNMAEVTMGKMAQANAQSADVKQFGERMVADHTKSNEELRPFAQSEKIAWPADVDAKHKTAHDRLVKLSGGAFDRAYMQQMVQDHTEKIAMLRTVSQNAKDPEIKAWAAKSLSMPEAHLEAAKSIAAKVSGAK